MSTRFHLVVVDCLFYTRTRRVLIMKHETVAGGKNHHDGEWEKFSNPKGSEWSEWKLNFFHISHPTAP